MHASFVAMPAWKHPVAKLGNHLERHRRPGTASPTPSAPENGASNFRGRTKGELLAVARRLGLRGRSRMTKAALARAIARAR